jgi:hypothetical protein
MTCAQRSTRVQQAPFRRRGSFAWRNRESRNPRSDVFVSTAPLAYCCEGSRAPGRGVFRGGEGGRGARPTGLFGFEELGGQNCGGVIGVAATSSHIEHVPDPGADLPVHDRLSRRGILLAASPSMRSHTHAALLVSALRRTARRAPGATRSPLRARPSPSIRAAAATTCRQPPCRSVPAG